jgi:2,4-dienoyl-CoA reductase-like NADH-dependent reductase (Old Yellow Enzyme family)
MLRAQGERFMAGGAKVDSLGKMLQLRCGATLKNRLAKSAMTEGLADSGNRATAAHARLYRRWAGGGCGLLLTGNIQIDRAHLERPGNVVFDGAPDAAHRTALADWVAAGTAGGTHLWTQLNHAGRQTPKTVNAAPKAPSAVPVALPGKQFGMPVALTAREIGDLVADFARAATISREAGFTGVQLHAAHGYLLSSFLSPLANRRGDDWGGSLENRARFLLDAVRATRAAVGADYPVSVKLNSADFQRGGFAVDDSAQVAAWLAEAGVDLIELSGGSYEQPRMMGSEGLQPAPGPAARTAAREAYFLEEAVRLRAAVDVPMMVTGGFRTAAGMAAAVEAGATDVVGLARPLCTDPDAPAALLDGRCDRLPGWEDNLRLGPGWLGPQSPFDLVRLANGWGVQGWFCVQLLRMGAGQDPDPGMTVFQALRRYAANEAAAAKAWDGPGIRAAAAAP